VPGAGVHCAPARVSVHACFDTKGDEAMSRRSRVWASAALCVCVISLGIIFRGDTQSPMASSQAADVAVGEAAVFTMTDPPDAASFLCGGRPFGLRLDTGEAASEYPQGVSPLGVLSSTPNLSVIVAGNVAGYYGQPCRLDAERQRFLFSIYVLACSGSDLGQCMAMSTVKGTDFYTGVEIMPDADTLLVSTAKRTPLCGPTAPFSVEKYSVGEIRPLPQRPGEWATHELGARGGVIDTQDPIIAILRDPDGLRAHLVARGGSNPTQLTLHTIDVASMAEVAAPIVLPRLPSSLSPWTLPRASLSADGSLLVVTRPMQPSFALVNMTDRSAKEILVQGVEAVSDVSLNDGPNNRGLAAFYVHLADGLTQTVVAQLEPDGMTELGRGPAAPGSLYLAPSVLEWTSDGTGVVVSVDTGDGGPTAALLPVQNAGRTVLMGRDLTPCTGKGVFVADILTAGGAAPTPTATPPSSPSPSGTPPATPSPTITPTPTAVDTPTTMRPPTPIYLPIVLREHCAPKTQRVDVALVIDASTTMRDDRTTAGRAKLAAAIEAATTFAGTLALPLDQAAVITFNSDAQLLQGLSGKRADIERALGQIPRLVRQQTRIDRGIEEAHKELVGPRHKAANMRVMIVLTDGLANPVPASTAVRRAQEAKNSQITIFTIGLGKNSEVNVDELRQMATTPAYFYHAPDGEDLLDIYRAIGVEIPCPAQGFWGRR